MARKVHSRIRTAFALATALPLVAQAPAGHYAGFDRNLYPGDDRLATLHQHFAFTGYWLTPPPGETVNTWIGKRPQLLKAGYGFLVLANGRLDAQIRATWARTSIAPTQQGQQDAQNAIAAAHHEGFPPKTILFLDQEEGGRLLSEQADYFYGWTETVAASPYRPGAYLSGQSSPDGIGPDGKPLLITTAQDVQQHIAAKHLHSIALWVAQDSCPPAPGCSATPPPLTQSGTPAAIVWQYAQSPRRPALTRSCGKTYAPDNNCYAGITNDLLLDLNVAATPDPSQGR